MAMKQNKKGKRGEKTLIYTLVSPADALCASIHRAASVRSSQYILCSVEVSLLRAHFLKCLAFLFSMWLSVSTENQFVHLAGAPLLKEHVCIFEIISFSLAVTASVAWTTVTEITGKQITRRLSLWVEFPSGGVGETSVFLLW